MNEFNNDDGVDADLVMHSHNRFAHSTGPVLYF